MCKQVHEVWLSRNKLRGSSLGSVVLGQQSAREINVRPEPRGVKWTLWSLKTSWCFMGKWENILFRDCTAHTSDVFSSSLSLSLCNFFFLFSFFFSFLNYHRGQFAWEGSLSVKCPSAVQPHLPPDDTSICFWHHSHSPGSHWHLMNTLPRCLPAAERIPRCFPWILPSRQGWAASGWAGLVSGSCRQPESVLGNFVIFDLPLCDTSCEGEVPLASASWELNNNN